MSASRQFPRYAVAANVELHHAAGLAQGRTRNVSRGGLCAVSQGSVSTGTEVEARISLVFKDGAVSEPLLLPMRVVWCTTMGTAAGSEFQIGCAFLQLTPDQRQYLEVFLRYLEEGSAGERAEAAAHAPPVPEKEDPFTD